MSLNRRKKSIKFRGDHTHGYGSKKKHRGSGHQGGVGMAGTGKKADQKKTMVWKDKKYFGRHGFHSIMRIDVSAVNIFYIDTHIDLLVKEGKAKKEGSKYTIDLKDLKFNKLLGSGTPTKEYHIKVDYATPGAIEKIQSAKGTVTVKNAKE